MHFCNRHQIPSIPSYLSLDEFPFHHAPFVAKERYSFSRKCLHFFETKEEARPLLSAFQTPLFQPKIEGIEYSIDVYRSRKTHEARALVRRRDIVIGTEAYLTTPLRHEALESLTLRAAQALSIEGHATFQAIESPDHALHFLECNPRIGGASTASFMNGLSSIEWFLQEEIVSQTLPPFQQNRPFIPQLRIREDIALVSSPDVYT
jgi:carbamoyl-phosphate synthase large subunit